jgi:DNA-binding NarL/FixJ family response regulator
VLQLASKNDFLNNLQNEVVELLKESVDSSVNKTSKRISSMIRKDMNGDKQWEQFGEEFSSIHQGFIASLAKEFGAFTKTEVRLISLLKMNLSSKEIADILSISDEGIKKARYRLRKKINLEDSELQGFLLNFS